MTQRQLFLATALLFMLSHSLFATSISDSLLFKNGDVLYGNIKSLNPWSVTLTDDNYYALKMLTEVKTTDSSIVQQFKAYYPDIAVSRTDSMFVIEVAGLKLLPIDEYQNNFAYRYFILLNAMSARAENVEFQINLVPRFCHSVIGQVAISTGADLRHNAAHVQQASIGVGYLYPFDNAYILANVNLANRTLYPDYISDIVTYLSLYTQIVAGDELFFSVGGRYYISNISVNDDNMRFSFSVGIGYNFQISPN